MRSSTAERNDRELQLWHLFWSRGLNIAANVCTFLARFLERLPLYAVDSSYMHGVS